MTRIDNAKGPKTVVDTGTPTQRTPLAHDAVLFLPHGFKTSDSWRRHQGGDETGFDRKRN